MALTSLLSSTKASNRVSISRVPIMSIKMRKRRGPRMVPCGIPLILSEDSSLLTRTSCFLLVRKLCSYTPKDPDMALAFIFWHNSPMYTHKNHLEIEIYYIHNFPFFSLMEN